MHARRWRQNLVDVRITTIEEPNDPLAIEAGYMLTGQEFIRLLKMACLVAAGIASFLAPPWRNAIAFALFAVPILSIGDSILTERSVAKQLRLAQNRNRG